MTGVIVTKPQMAPRASGLRWSIVPLVLFALAPQGATASPVTDCEPVALLQGPPAIVQSIKIILNEHGVRVSSQPQCAARTIQANIEAHRDQTGFTLTTIDDAGRTSARVFADAQTAASLIESWILDEDAMLLAPPPTLDAGLIARPTLASLQSKARVHVHVGPETSFGADRSLWLGVTFGACVRASALCLGARLRSTRDMDLSGASEPDTVLRENADLLATVAWLHAAGNFLMMPVLGVGAGWLRTRTEGGLLRDALVINSRGLRLEASVQGRWPLSPHASLAAELGGTWSPQAHSQSIDDQGAILIGEPAVQVRLGLFCVVTP